MRTLLIIVVIAIAAAGGWFFGRNTKPGAPAAVKHKVAFYQCPMHPWIKSDQPGNCTICGMKLTPIHGGGKGFATDANVVSLSSNAINVINVQTETAQVRPIERALQVAGKIETDKTRLRVISAYVDGRIDKLFVNFTGAEVKEGEPLAMIYSPALLTAEREYLTLTGQTNFAESPSLSAQHERLIEGARQRLRRLGLSDEQIAGLDREGRTNVTTQVIAPIGGTVVTRSVFEGQYVKEGDRLFEIADLSRMWFQFDVYEQDLPFIQAGDTVRVTSPALGASSFEGAITFIDPNIDQETRSARVRVELANPVIDEGKGSRRELFNGLYAEGSITIKTEPVLTVSRSAVLRPGDGARVFVEQRRGAYERRAVKAGRQGEEFIEILDGLEEGERVVSSGNLLLDSQAQLNQGSAPGEDAGIEVIPHEHLHPTHEKTSGDRLSPPQIAGAKEFLTFVSGLNEQLAADNLERYNELLAQTAEAISSFAKDFTEESALKAQVDKVVEEGRKLRAASDLAAARARHNSFSKATAELFRAAKAMPGEIKATIYKCPMYPKLGQNAFWVQAEGPLRNPFFGPEMLECGVEVK